MRLSSAGTFKVPTRIDYLSLDIEGAEYQAMRSFPFHTYEFSVVSIERPARPLRELLVKMGYFYLCSPGFLFGEDMFFHKSLPMAAKIHKLHQVRHRLSFCAGFWLHTLPVLLPLVMEKACKK